MLRAHVGGEDAAERIEGRDRLGAFSAGRGDAREDPLDRVVEREQRRPGRCSVAFIAGHFRR